MFIKIITGFKIKFLNDQVCIHYHGEVMLKDIYAGGFENEIARMLNEIKNIKIMNNSDVVKGVVVE